MVHLPRSARNRRRSILAALVVMHALSCGRTRFVPSEEGTEEADWENSGSGGLAMVAGSGGSSLTSGNEVDEQDTGSDIGGGGAKANLCAVGVGAAHSTIASTTICGWISIAPLVLLVEAAIEVGIRKFRCRELA